MSKYKLIIEYYQKGKVKNGITEIVFILDKSGSMSGYEKDTIGGFNSTIEKQKQEEGTAIVSTVLFDHDIDVIHDRISMAKIEMEIMYGGGKVNRETRQLKVGDNLYQISNEMEQYKKGT